MSVNVCDCLYLYTAWGKYFSLFPYTEIPLKKISTFLKIFGEGKIGVVVPGDNPELGHFFYMD